MAFAKPANGRITRHFTDGFDLVGQKQRARAQSRGGSGGFASGMSGADYNDIIREHEASIIEIGGESKTIELMMMSAPNPLSDIYV
jgi:hypothetical protein